MSNNDALSQPIAYTDREELESMQGPGGDTYANLWTIPHGFGQDIALYSQEYVTTLQSALKLEQEQSAYYEQHMWHFHGLAESEIKRAEAAEQRLELVREQHNNELRTNSKLERRLQQLIKLPAAEGELEQNYLDKVIKALNSAGVQIRYDCPRCNGLLDLTCRPNGAHYCHQQAKAEIK
ncbi:hypothetical protein [Serratia sp. N21D137]|uniref:hypothetical protein n=1 Tax=Serratia sp. N21D137 TaxID=3397495 RepID=UPI0039E1A595